MEQNNNNVPRQAASVMSPSNEPVLIATHSGGFHADDIVGVAVLQLLFPNSRLVRTRDAAKIAEADFAVDVGGVWDPATGRFDHHQKGFSGARESGVVYASAGLVWAAYGEHCVAQSVGKYVSEDQVKQIVAEIDDELMQHLDRADTGDAKGAPGLFGMSALLAQYNPSWLEEMSLEKDERDAQKLRHFRAAVDVTRTLLERIIVEKASDAAAGNLVRNGQRHFDGKVLMLGDGSMPWIKAVCRDMPEVAFVIYPDSSDQQWQLRTVPVEPESFVARADLPRAWAGLRDADLAAATGVADAAFCHNNVFIGGAYSLKGALRMAELALKDIGQLRSAAVA
jgi:uncharacterized UPF0160 family protein